MGGFHCPLGAMAPGMDGCIKCGLCSAGSKREYAAATEKMREYIREHAPKTDRIRKMVVCGKGGVGKSTVTSIFARVLAKAGYRVLVIDTDESNPTLSRALDLPSPKCALRKMNERFEPVSCGEWIKDVITFDDIPREYISQSGNLSLITAGKIEDPFSGCACALGELSRELMLNLSLKENDIVIADIEAGVESFGRGVERGADTVIAVMEPSLDSIEVAEKVKYMAEGLGISRVRVVVNKVPSDEIGEKVLDMLAEKETRYLGYVPTDKDAAMHSLLGTVIRENEPVYHTLESLLMLLLDENEMDHTV